MLVNQTEVNRGVWIDGLDTMSVGVVRVELSYPIYHPEYALTWSVVNAWVSLRRFLRFPRSALW